MPELPEITVIAKQMDKELSSKRIVDVEVKQPKILNMPVSEFVDTLVGKMIEDVSSRGKWIFVRLSSPYFMLINLGMGAELIYSGSNQKLQEKYHFRLTLSDKTGFTAHFWWFGYIHLLSESQLPEHKLTAKLGKSATDKTFRLECLKNSLAKKKTSIKAFLLDQRNLSGIGNVYVQDILFKAKLHPNRKTSTLSEDEIATLHKSIQEVLKEGIRLRGLAYEKDFYGKRGNLTTDRFLVGYRQGKPCPECGTAIEKIKTGSTSSYVCPKCQLQDLSPEN
jgi:formamidopyrimidine-DNA glycosylase